MIPEGFRRCPQCGQLKGEVFSPDPYRTEPDWVEISCLCEGIVCRRCKKNAIRRPISNHYDEETGEVWHVPWFGADVRCTECRER